MSRPPLCPSLGCRVLILSLLLALAPGCPRGRPAATPDGLTSDPPLLVRTPGVEKFEGDFRRSIEAAPPGEHVRALVDLTDQVDLLRLADRLRASGRTKAHRRAAFIGALERVAEDQQARLQPEVDRLIEAGQLDYVRPVAIVNRLMVEGRPAGILALADSPEVARVRPDWTSMTPGISYGDSLDEAPLGDRFTSWAVAAMGAERLWERGWTGAGVLVASIDTGAYGEHEQLRDHNVGGARGWFDPVRGSATPFDSHHHGTTVLSVAVGANPDGRVLGIAPDAKWASALGNSQNFYSRWRMTEAADWILRVARPDVLINAWSHDEGECNDFDLAFINAWKGAEIFVVFPAGNAGPLPATGDAPASLAGTLPDGGPVLSVAALARDGDVYARSSRGPSRCGSPRFPTLGAPGHELPVAVPGSPSAYRTADGTSLAAGIVGGAAALLLHAEPELSPHALERLLTETARDLPPPGRDDASGAGVIDLPAALDRLARGFNR